MEFNIMFSGIWPLVNTRIEKKADVYSLLQRIGKYCAEVDVEEWIHLTDKELTKVNSNGWFRIISKAFRKSIPNIDRFLRNCLTGKQDKKCLAVKPVLQAIFVKFHELLYNKLEYPEFLHDGYNFIQETPAWQQPLMIPAGDLVRLYGSAKVTKKQMPKRAVRPDHFSVCSASVAPSSVNRDRLDDFLADCAQGGSQARDPIPDNANREASGPELPLNVVSDAEDDEEHTGNDGTDSQAAKRLKKEDLLHGDIHSKTFIDYATVIEQAKKTEKKLNRARVEEAAVKAKIVALEQKGSLLQVNEETQKLLLLRNDLAFELGSRMIAKLEASGFNCSSVQDYDMALQAYESLVQPGTVTKSTTPPQYPEPSTSPYPYSYVHEVTIPQEGGSSGVLPGPPPLYRPDGSILNPRK